MKYVLDASVALRWVLPGPSMTRALRLRDEYMQHIHELIAPAIYTAEVAGGLTKAERQRLIRIGQARPFAFDVLQTPPVLFPYDPLLPRAIDISSQTRSALYDCLYVALAEREGCEMVTDDDKLLRNLQALFPFVRALASLP